MAHQVLQYTVEGDVLLEESAVSRVLLVEGAGQHLNRFQWQAQNLGQSRVKLSEVNFVGQVEKFL